MDKNDRKEGTRRGGILSSKEVIIILLTHNIVFHFWYHCHWFAFSPNSVLTMNDQQTPRVKGKNHKKKQRQKANRRLRDQVARQQAHDRLANSPQFKHNMAVHYNTMKEKVLQHKNWEGHSGSLREFLEFFHEEKHGDGASMAFHGFYCACGEKRVTTVVELVSNLDNVLGEYDDDIESMYDRDTILEYADVWIDVFDLNI